MSSPTPTVTSSFKFDKEKVAAHFKALEAKINEVAGKPGHNPFVHLEKYNANALYARFLKGEESEELKTKVLAIPLDIPPVLKANLPKPKEDKK